MAGEAHISATPCKTSSTINADGLSVAGIVASFKIQVSRTSFKVRFGGPQGPAATASLNHSNRLGVGQRMAGVALLGARQRRTKPESLDPAVNDCSSHHPFRLTAAFPCFKHQAPHCEFVNMFFLPAAMAREKLVTF